MHSKTFIHQLHAILSESHLQEWISWSTEDDTVFVLKPHDSGFSEMVLKRYFKHGNVSSFVRQLHMYGFHKITRVPENPTGGKNGNSSKDRSDIVWSFKHPQGHFRKGADVATLKKIQRKSAGVGKDGRRKNVLSTVCINYVGSASQEVNQGVAEQHNRRHYASLPLLPPAGPIMHKLGPKQQQQQSEQPLLPHLHHKEHLIARSRTISLPDITQRSATGVAGSSAVSPVPTPVVGQQPHHRSSSPLYSVNAFQYQPSFSHASGPLGSYTTPSSSVVSSNSTAAYMMNDYHQRLENNLQTLRKSLAVVADVLPSLCNDFNKGFTKNEKQKPRFDHYTKTLQTVKDDLITDKNWLDMRRSQASTIGGSSTASFHGYHTGSIDKTLVQLKESTLHAESSSSPAKGTAQGSERDHFEPAFINSHSRKYDRPDPTSPIPKP